MILEAIGGSLPMAIGIALSPFPVTAVIIMLVTAKANSNAPAYLLGWFLGIVTVGLIVFIVPGIETARGEPTALSAWIKLVLGSGFLLLCLLLWFKQRTSHETEKIPHALAHLDQIGALKATITGFLFSSANPKNLVLGATGAATIDTSMLEPVEQFVVLIGFASIASLTIAIPIAAHFLVRDKAKVTLGIFRNWLIRNNVRLVIIVLLILGTLLIREGLSILRLDLS